MRVGVNVRGAFRMSVCSALVVAGASACGGDGGNDARAPEQSRPYQETRADGKTLAHHVHLRGHYAEERTRNSLKRTQEDCVWGKKLEGKQIDEPSFPAGGVLLTRVEQDAYYTESASITYTESYWASIDLETCNVTVPREPISVRVRIFDGSGGCIFRADDSGPKECALSRKGYRASPKESASGMSMVTHVGHNDPDHCEIVDARTPGTKGSVNRFCVLLRADGWKSYSFFGTALAGLVVQHIISSDGKFNDIASISSRYEANSVETDVMVSDAIIYPHLSGNYDIDFILLEDARHSWNELAHDDEEGDDDEDWDRIF